MTPRLPRLAITIATCLTLAACGGEDTTDTAGLPTAEDLAAEREDGAGDDGATSGGAAAGSCLVGDPDCTDESYDGQDVSRPVPLVETLDEQEDLQPATRGATSGATGRVIEQAALVAPDTVRVVVIGSPCMLVEDVLVIESTDEVRVLVLGGQDATVDGCEDEGLWWSVDVDLDAPLGDRTLLDLAG